MDHRFHPWATPISLLYDTVHFTFSGFFPDREFFAC
jgi:hypothetical protein